MRPSALFDLNVILGAAALATLAGFLAAAWPRRPSMEEWLRVRSTRRSSERRERRRSWYGRARAVVVRLGGSTIRHSPTGIQSAVSGLLQRAGIATQPEILVSLTLLLTFVMTCVMVALVDTGLFPPSLAVIAVMATPLLVGGRVVRIASRRRKAIIDQLPILVDLMALEQGGGGVGARTAIELVVNRLHGEAAAVLRECLALSAMAGTPQLDRQLETAAMQLGIPAFAALAAVVRIQREEGVSATTPLGQLASGLRDRQKDEMISRGRKALVTMLLPVGLCILLPFVIIILFPAVDRLSTAFS